MQDYSYVFYKRTDGSTGFEVIPIEFEPAHLDFLKDELGYEIIEYGYFCDMAW